MARNKEGMRANFLEIKETHKDILFMDWDARIKQDELAMTRAARVSKNIVKVVKHNLNATNLVKEGNLKILPNLNDLHKSWKKRVEIQREVIAKLDKTD